MDTFTEEHFQSLVQAIKKSAPDSISLINGFIKTDRSSGRLLKAANVQSVRISKEVRIFKADEPCYIKFVDVYGEDPGAIARRVTMVATKLDGEKFKVDGELINLQGQSNVLVPVARYKLGYWCSAVEINAQTFLRGIKTTKFKVYGYTAGQLESAAGKVIEVSSLVSRIDSYVSGEQAKAVTAKEEAEQYEEERDEIQADIANLQEQKASLSTEVDALKQESESLSSKKNLIEKDLVEYGARLSGAQSNESQLKESADRLSKEIVERKDELKLLLNDRSLISDEYKDYVLEGRKQSRMYEWFLFFSIAIIAFCAWQLYSGAQRILVADVTDYKHIWVLVLQRMPFAAAIAFVVGAAWKLAEMFVTRIMNIHAQRLALTRLLVIAKDTVFSSVDSLDVSDEIKFKERIRLKLQMLKSHLTSELGREFEYKVAEDSKPPSKESAERQGDEGEGDEEGR